MSVAKKHVSIQLAMQIDDHGKKEYNIIKSHGVLYQRGTFDVLIYEEKLDAGLTVRNLVTIQPDKITIKRTGSVEMTQTFLKGRLTETRYQHPYGHLHMETYTKAFTYDAEEEAGHGELKITYDVRLNGDDARQHELKLTYQQEDEA